MPGPGKFELAVETVGALVLVVVMPFYMGFQHQTVAQLGLYCGVAGTGLKVGENALFPGTFSETPREFVGDAAMFTVAIAGPALLIYLLAVLLV